MREGIVIAALGLGLVALYLFGTAVWAFVRELR
jgi:hypothetical protein